MPQAERIEYTKNHLTVSSDGPFPDGTFTKKADISTAESLAVMSFFAILMAGPVILIVLLLTSLIYGAWQRFLLLVVLWAALALHPLPDNQKMCTHPFTLMLYKYFTYRFMWCDDVLEEVHRTHGWIGAGAPHGVLPIANFLSMPAINAVAPNKFVGGPASIVLITPFLRYMTVFGGAVDVSGPSLKRASGEGTCIGIVPDGIAGIFQQNAGQDEERVALKKRMGLAKLSIRNNIPVVPAYSMGNTAVYSSWYDSLGIMEGLSRKLQTSIFVFWGRWGLPIPKRANITMLLAKPIWPKEVVDNPSKEQVESMHQRILDGIVEAFNLHKGCCGWKERQIVFV